MFRIKKVKLHKSRSISYISLTYKYKWFIINCWYVVRVHRQSLDYYIVLIKILKTTKLHINWCSPQSYMSVPLYYYRFLDQGYVHHAPLHRLSWHPLLRGAWHHNHITSNYPNTWRPLQSSCILPNRVAATTGRCVCALLWEHMHDDNVWPLVQPCC